MSVEGTGPTLSDSNIQPGRKVFLQNVSEMLSRICRRLVLPRQLTELLSRSLSATIALTLTVMLLVMLLIIGWFVNLQLVSQLFQDRKDIIIDDAAVRYTQVQGVLDQSTATTVDQVQDLALELVSSTLDSGGGAGAVSVMLLRSPDSSDSFVINELGNQDYINLVSDELRDDVVETGTHWQSVRIFKGTTSGQPGIMVGAVVDFPSAGPYELYILYSLESEQNAIDLTMGVFAFALIPLLLVMSGATFWLVYRMLRPVRSTAQAALKLAGGDLESRVSVQGNNEMSKLGKSFNDMASSLQKQIVEYDHLSQLQQRFVSDVSHELRTPLTTIRMAEEMIYDAREELDPASKRSAELLHSEAARLENMLADLLEISRYDANSTALEMETVDLYYLVEKTVIANRELADHLGVKVIISERPDRPTVEADSKRLERVVRNLLVNAYEYSEKNPVEVRVISTATNVAIEVEDHGVGMSEETIARVFDRFFRADPARTRTTGGTGLGLAIAYEDVSAHHGTITATGTIGVGSTFVVEIPRHRKESD